METFLEYEDPHGNVNLSVDTEDESEFVIFLGYDGFETRVYSLAELYYRIDKYTIKEGGSLRWNKLKDWLVTNKLYY